mmetsp:Transcript_83206/g.165179  ORF Transcript_83206/g.165179 Transcript_83206/m.165179 type:complete len:354 (+) Transcript_83206:71-1132(+)
MLIPSPPLSLVKKNNGRYSLQAPDLGGAKCTPQPGSNYRLEETVAFKPEPTISTNSGAVSSLSTCDSKHHNSSPDLGRCSSLSSTTEFMPPSRPFRGLDLEGGMPERLRGKLMDLGPSFTGLERQVEDDKRRRHDIEQRKIQELLLVMDKLGRTLSAEVGHREQATASLQQAIDKSLEAMVARVQMQIVARFGKLSQSVESLCERCATVERGIQQLRGEVPSKLQVESVRLQFKLREFAADLHTDHGRRVESDAQMLRSVEEVEHSIDFRMQRELAQLERQIEALQELIDEIASAAERPEARNRRDMVFATLASVRDGMAAEARTREAADDEVVQAINQYTAMLHRSLSTLNS